MQTTGTQETTVKLGAGGDEQQLVVFELGAELYGVEIARVHEIIRLQAVTRVPRSPAFVEGVINLRGKVIPLSSSATASSSMWPARWRTSSSSRSRWPGATSSCCWTTPTSI